MNKTRQNRIFFLEPTFSCEGPTIFPKALSIFKKSRSDDSDYDYTVIGCAEKGEDNVNNIYININIYIIVYPLLGFS